MSIFHVLISKTISPRTFFFYNSSILKLLKCSHHIVPHKNYFFTISTFPKIRYSSSTSGSALSTQSPHKLEEKVDIDILDDGDCGGIKLDMDLVSHLERTSLVDFGHEEALLRLKEAVTFANNLFEVDTSSVQPLTSILEDESLYLREDKVGDTNRDDILLNASVTEEDYFVAPPGNIPLDVGSTLTGIETFKYKKK